jgi:hypothetical protein
MAAQPMDQLAGRAIPDGGRLIAATGSNRLAVRCKGHGWDETEMSKSRRPQPGNSAGRQRIVMGRFLTFCIRQNKERTAERQKKGKWCTVH